MIKKKKLETNEQSGHRRVRYLNLVEKKDRILEMTNEKLPEYEDFGQVSTEKRRWLF